MGSDHVRSPPTQSMVHALQNDGTVRDGIHKHHFFNCSKFMVRFGASVLFCSCESVPVSLLLLQTSASGSPRPPSSSALWSLFISTVRFVATFAHKTFHKAGLAVVALKTCSLKLLFRSRLAQRLFVASLRVAQALSSLPLLRRGVCFVALLGFASSSASLSLCADLMLFSGSPDEAKHFGAVARSL